MAAQRYVIAVRREARDTAPPDWQERLRSIDGLTVLGTARPNQVQVEATDEAIDRARSLVGSYCHVEPFIRHEAR